MTDLSLPAEKQVVVAGDWHGNFSWVEKALPAIIHEAPYMKTILHVGDFGLWRGARAAQYLDTIDRLCVDGGLERILVTPGNHEDWSLLDQAFAKQPGEPVQFSDTVWMMPRGFRFSLSGRTFMSFGGAASIDYAQRTKGHDWFPTEIPTDEDEATAIAGGSVDVLITHESVYRGTAAADRALRSNPLGWSPEELAYSSVSRELVTRLWKATGPRVLLHGHMHTPDEIEFADGSQVISLGRDEQRHNLGILDLQELSWEWGPEPQRSPRVKRTRNAEANYLTRPGESSTGEQ